MADHVPLLELDEGQIRYPGQHPLETDQTRAPAGDVDLGDVPGDHRLGTEPDAGEEHLHLLGAGVLGLVEDDEAVVQGAPAHEGQRGHLDGAPVDEPLRALGLQEVVQGVVEGSEVGVDLGHQVPGEEAQPLAGLDGRPGQDDPVDLSRLEGLDGERHRQIGLSGAGGADPEGHDVGGDGIRVLLLPAGLRANRAAP